MAKLIAITSDLFLQSRFLELARSHNVEAEMQNAPKPPLSNRRPTLVVLDLASSEYDPFETARAFKGNSAETILLGYYPHVRIDLKRRAEEAGFDHVVINRELILRMSGLLESLAGSGR